MEKNTNTYRQKKLIRAQERVAEIKKFYSGIISYVFVIGGLAALNYYIDSWNYPWFLWAAFGWGIGIIINAIKLFGRNPFFNKDWEQRKIKEIMDKERDI